MAISDEMREQLEMVIPMVTPNPGNVQRTR